MKKNEIDRIFKEKLDRHDSTPSAAAWKSLNAQLQQNKTKSNRKLYWMAAAVSLILFSAGWLVINQPLGTNTSTGIASTTAEAPSTLPETTEVPVIRKAIVAEAETPEPSTIVESVAQPLPAKIDIIASSKALASNKAETETVNPLNVSTEVQPTKLLIESVVPELTIEGTEPVLAKVSVPTETIVIEYVPVQKPAIAAQPVYAKQAASEEKTKEEPVILKVLEDVKSGNLGLADLRAAKNNLFAKLNRP